MANNNKTNKTTTITSPKIMGYLTPRGRAYCAECATPSIIASAVEVYTIESISDFSVTCHTCDEDIVEWQGEE